MLDTFLTAFAGRRMFVNYRVEPKAGGGTNKLPTCPLTGRNIDAQNPSNWMTPEEARATGLPVGIVITEGCGIACIDLDHCIVDGVWTPFALGIMARFPEAAKELSNSLTGAHVFVTCGPIPPHRTRRTGQGLEVYDRARFIALTENGFVGDPRVDYTAELQALIAEYFPEAPGKRPDAWTTEPYEGWRGGGTDEQILQQLRARRPSPRALFGVACTFSQLWDCDADALGRAFPPEKPGQPYNASSADQSLANHLAHATGFNCDHVRRLMLDYDCQLRREKWNREDYLYDTIMKACERREAEALAAASRLPVVSVPTSPAVDDQTVQPITAPAGAVQVIPPPPSLSPSDPERLRRTFTPGAYITTSDQLRLFEGMIWVSDINEISYANGLMKDQSRFNIDFGGFIFQMTADGSKPTKKAWETFTESELVEFPRVESLTFDPRLPARSIITRDGHRMLNSYVPVDVPAIEGDISLFTDHVKKMYPYGQDAEILISYFKAMVQHKGVKFQWAPILQGVEGNGKTFLSEMMTYCMSRRYTHTARASKIDSSFNAAFEGKLLIIIEDIKISESREAAWEALKPMITNTTMEIEPKGVDKITRDVCFNLIMNSNHKDAIRKTANDRRLANFFGAQQKKLDLLRDGMTPAYFKRLYDWGRHGGGFAAIHHFLLNTPIPDEFNPATGCTVAPETTSTGAALHASTGSIEQELAEAIASERPGFAGGWITNVKMADLMAQLHMSRVITLNRRHEMLLEAGYIWHPALKEGRSKCTLPDGSRPQFYIRPDSPAAALKDPREIMNAYLEAQAVK